MSFALVCSQPCHCDLLSGPVFPVWISWQAQHFVFCLLFSLEEQEFSTVSSLLPIAFSTFQCCDLSGLAALYWSQVGRTSGDAAWREQRGELGANALAKQKAALQSNSWLKTRDPTCPPAWFWQLFIISFLGLFWHAVEAWSTERFKHPPFPWGYIFYSAKFKLNECVF